MLGAYYKRFPQITLFPLLNIYKIVVNLNILKIEIEENLKRYQNK